MAGKDKANSQSQSQAHFLTEDILINILLRLPIASCIFRFRCVCRSWRILLSDPQFIRKILFFRNPADQRSLQILIAGGDLDPASLISKFHYSLHSYDTLRPISAASAVGRELPFIPDKIRDPLSRLTVVGCCDGIFCISDENERSPSEIILWNSMTSETKLLPRSTCPRAPSGTIKGCESIGLGFDPLTGDYKVVRTLKYSGNEEADSDDYYDFGYVCPPATTFKEVYSLKNDSWKRLTDKSCSVGWTPGYVHQDTSRNEKCYWYYSIGDENFYLITFDVSKEVFRKVTFAAPPGKDGCFSQSCFMLKEALVTTFDDFGPLEVWGLMKYQGSHHRRSNDQKRKKKYRASKSWTKLFTFPRYEWHRNLEAWKEGMFICSRRVTSRDSHDPESKDTDGVFVLDPATGGITGDSLETQGRTHSFQAHTYTPTQVSLSVLS
ncbi:unnamed protein product [Linum tenue]|uniref:F-box domain-containing protein n=1 Tax=Linum tenue TaxID=586396 RepID=A0AAV0NNQ3_9ROSI|nr:unnamed protein product [Linum tenue]